jgi:Flp pilus assembly protein TadD
MSSSAAPLAKPRTWIVSPAWDLAYLVLTPVAIVPAVLIAAQQWLSPEQIYLAVISFASLGHHLPGFMRAYGDRALFQQYRWRFLVAPPLVFALAVAFTPPASVARALDLPWTHLHGLELILLLWGTWHGLMQTYGFMRIYDLRRGENDRRAAMLDRALCIAIFVAGVAFSDMRMFGLAGAMWQSGLPLFGPGVLAAVRWVVGIASAAVLAAYIIDGAARLKRGAPVNGVKLLLAGVTGLFWWYCGTLSPNLLIGVAMFEIFHAVQYNAIVWIYNRRLMARAGERFGPLGFLFRDRLTMLGLYLGAIAAYSSIRFFTAQPSDRMFSGDLAGAHQWLIAAFVTSSLLHFYYDGFIWKVSQPKTRDTLADAGAPLAPAFEHLVPGFVHAGKWVALAAAAGLLVAAERQYRGPQAAQREAAQRAALAALTPRVPEAAMLAAQDALAAGDARSAVDHARVAVAARPDSHEALAELGLALLEAGDNAEAATALERAAALAPIRWEYLCDLGQAYEHLGELPKAEGAFRRAMKLAPDDAEPWDRLAALLLREGCADEAIPILRKLLTLEGDNAELHYRLGLALSHRGDAGDALPLLQKAVALDPQHYAAWLLLGDALMAQAKPSLAIDAYRRAVDLHPNVSAAWVGWADALLQSGRVSAAEDALRKGLEQLPDSPELCLTLGVLLQQLGRQDEAGPLLELAQRKGLDVGAALGAP